jgi:Ni2+-binding GTPase involved in maturation of urease and hydrogenase
MDNSKKPLCLIVMGMAGSGKTTFVEVSNFSFIKLNSSNWPFS